MKGIHSNALTVLLVDDEPEMLVSSSAVLKSAGIRNVQTIEDSRKVLPYLSSHKVAVVVLDIFMPYISGKTLLTNIAVEYPHVPVIVMTAANEIETAVECMKSGAFDYLVKPVEKSRFISSVKRALEVCTLREEVSSLKRQLFADRLEHEEAFKDIITCSKKMKAVFQYVEVIAPSDHPVLITGETGVGKELIARAIHRISRRKGDFVGVNVAGLDDTMFSDTMFGHKRGAYSGADTPREGLISRAEDGTLFLDEIGDLSEASQIRMLRLLQEREYYPLGSDIPRRTNARIICATNRDIHKLMLEGRFRKDLYYRLYVHHIHVPPLRERLEDLPLLLNHFIKEASKGLKKRAPSYPPELVTLLRTYHFPGNVRELRAMVFDAVTRHRSGILSLESFKEMINRERIQAPTIPPHPQGGDLLQAIFGHFPTLKEAERYLVSEAMRLSKGNQRIAASLLGISRQALNKRLKKDPLSR